MRHDVRREMREVSQTERAQRIGRCKFVHLAADMPGVAVAIRGRELLGHRGIGGDAAVEKVVGKGA